MASWASLEYGGGWKLTHYAARRFFAPVLVTAQPDPDSGDIVLFAVNDTGAPIDLTIDVPAFFVTWKHGGADVWSDNGFTLLPGRPKVIKRTRSRDGLAGDAQVRHL